MRAEETDGIDFAGDFSGRNDGVYLMQECIEAPDAVEAWVQLPATLVGRGGCIIGNAFFADPYYCSLAQSKLRTDVPLFQLTVNENGNPVVMWYDGDMYGDKSFEWTIKDVDLRTGEWTHIAFVRDISASSVKFYCNGQLHSSAVAVMGESMLTKTLGVGGNHIAVNKDYFQGKLKDVRIWSTVRDTGEILANYNSTVSADSEGLVANWLLQEKAPSSVILRDETGKHDLKFYSHWISEQEYSLPDADYTMIVIPDTQIMARDNPLMQRTMTKWIADNKEERNIVFAMHLGDYTNGLQGRNYDYAGWIEEWGVAKACMKLLTNAGIPFSSSAGNHDYDETPGEKRNTELFNRYFPLSEAQQLSCYGGAYEQDKIDNVYYLLDAGDQKYLIMALEFGPRDGVLEWAKGVVESYPDRQVIVTSHDGVSPGGNFSHKPEADAASFYSTINADCNDGIDIWNDFLSQHENIILFFNGHWTSESIVGRTDVGVHGNVVHSFLVNGQGTDFERGGVGLLGVLGFSENGNKITLNYYSSQNGFYGGMESQITFYIDETLAWDPDDDAGSLPVKTGCGAAAGAQSALTGGLAVAFCGLAVQKKKSR